MFFQRVTEPVETASVLMDNIEAFMKQLEEATAATPGQVILSTIGNIRQPKSQQFEPVATLPFVTEEFGELLRQA